ncbi:ribonucleotide-diphosphate reductase [Streptomyces phage BRock]|uniref:Ribonucleotide-diphosphate reductase n=1 Tax=Streptomyces phage BRock TaxID=1913591 RepID=A0A1J0GVZ2_9CAUD|nr:ribonucleotide-diphosphate reductase [Streptomyces phage BRock]APC46344.1 ribonucleotide-diphosphate reductase [Streptomyces phage BRock]
MTLAIEMSVFAETIYKQKYAQEGEEWGDTARRVISTVMAPYFPEDVEKLTQAVTDRKFMPGGRYLYATGKPFHQTQNCLLLTVEDSRESIADLMNRVASGLMTGAGIGIVWSKLRPNGAPVGGMGGTSTGPLAFMQAVNEIGRNIMQGGSRRSAIWAGLHWNHADVFDFMKVKDWNEDIVAMKEKDFNASAPMDMTNISIILDDDFFAAFENPFHEQYSWAQKVYWTAVEGMLKTGEPGFSVDVGENAGEHLRNACTEVTSRDDNDICNLGSLNLARIESREEMAELTELATRFLLCGTLYSKVPYGGVAETRKKNRRLGLGIMGVYEWLATRGKPYAPDEELGYWLDEYARSDKYATDAANFLGISIPVKTRAVAPTGTLGIVAETTTGVEPLFAVAYKRRYLKGTTWHFQYVVEPIAKRLADQGIDPDTLETAYTLSLDPGRRLAFQAWVQKYVDHGISSTLNLPSWESQSFTPELFGEILMEHLPNVRGVTVYPDGARGGQPLTVVSYAEAIASEGIEYEELGNGMACVSGVCGS